MSSPNIVSSYKRYAKDNQRGGQSGTGDFLLQSGGTDRILANNTNIAQSDGTLILLSPNNCNDLMLQSGGTDKILLSGTTDRLQISGYCTSNLITSQRRLMKSG